jgi:oxalate decarboxylase/phosphoglucose isomerase-like protein (cupin superfamily)
VEIKSTRVLKEMRDVLFTPSATGSNEVYWVFSDFNNKTWKNMTITTPGLYGKEFPKTYGHYHTTTDKTETYKLISGNGIFLLQKKHSENGVLIPYIVEEVILIGCDTGDEVTIKKEYGHSWSNVGDTPLITFDDWNWGHSPNDYEPIKQQHGMAYYIVSEQRELQLIQNPNYKNLPAPKWMTAKEFVSYSHL